MPTIKVFATKTALTDAAFEGAIPHLLDEVAGIMATDLDKVHIMGIEARIADGLNVAHVQVEYLPTPNRTEEFIATASDQIAALMAEVLKQDIRVRSWPTHGVAMAQLSAKTEV